MVDWSSLVAIIIGNIAPCLFADWHARMVFLAIGYPRKYGHGKSFNRAYKHYKKKWTLLQRLFWVPVFKEKYENKIIAFAYLSYLNYVIVILSLVLFLVNILFFNFVNFWEPFFKVGGFYFIARTTYTLGIARGSWWK